MHGFAGPGVLEDAAECEEVCANAQELAELFGTVLSVRVVREAEAHVHGPRALGASGGEDQVCTAASGIGRTLD